MPNGINRRLDVDFQGLIVLYDSRVLAVQVDPNLLRIDGRIDRFHPSKSKGKKTGPQCQFEVSTDGKQYTALTHPICTKLDYVASP